MSDPLDRRAAELLKLLVERYIHDGLPVGSRTLSRAGGLDLSPATIRNVMSDLDELGFVVSPHTSAGRVPTARGYRYFVDQLLTPEQLGEIEQARLTEALRGTRQPVDLVQTASGLLSQLTAMAGVVTVPRRNLAVLRRIEFLPLSGNRVLAILVVNQHEVQNRVIHTDRPYGADELEQYANALNEHFSGRDLVGLRRALLDEAMDAQNRVNSVLKAAATMAAQAMPDEQAQRDYVLAGGANLLGFQELSDVGRLRGLFDVLDRKRELLNLFDQCLDADGVQIFIGEESGYRVLDEVSVVTAPYYVDGRVAGRLGVIGPTRMAYSRIIPLVTQTAKLLSAKLTDED
ncbi:MAG TPA: heat-inducible transcriptional repressor HrcA [Nevskiaceae bacterium]|nr:heat-inducible transcriptional repressor HrcA [Nevskiaceae bacterium]